MRALALLLVLTACDTFDARRHDGPRDAAPPLPRAPSRTEMEARVRIALYAWRDAQTEGDVVGLASLYSPAAVGAAADARKALAAKKPELAVEQPAIKNVESTWIATFTERRRTAAHAEHGTTSLTFDEKVLIVREEPMAGAPGWEDPDPVVLDATALASPVTTKLGWSHGKLVLTAESGGKHADAPLHVDPAHPDRAVAPAPAPLLYEEKRLDGSDVDLFRIAHEGDDLVVRQSVQPSGSLDFPVARVRLAAGAKVVAR